MTDHPPLRERAEILMMLMKVLCHALVKMLSHSIRGEWNDAQTLSYLGLANYP